MGYGVVHHFPGGTKENYEASIAAVHPANGLPSGMRLSNQLVKFVRFERKRGIDTAGFAIVRHVFFDHAST